MLTVIIVIISIVFTIIINNKNIVIVIIIFVVVIGNHVTICHQKHVIGTGSPSWRRQVSIIRSMFSTGY